MCLVTQSCLTVCNPVDWSLPGSSVHRIPQARILSGFPCPPPGDHPDPGLLHLLHWQADSLPLSHSSKWKPYVRNKNW